ncbi:CAP domain-containing protein [Solirubrobacter soli]|uniref:CAP domain-containing protein n=1 Tax=Solirubrobacter soli TaxID=363832 RepID=UPI00040C7745|nr:CAP domain-containing protein [Solirubrobacter soli]
MSVTSVRRLSLAVLIICCLLVVPASASASHDATEAKIIRALNTARASYGLPKLRSTRALGRAADAHSRAMRRSNTIGHGDYSKRIRRYVRSRKVGENLAWMSGCNATSIVNMWLNSAPHRKVMLSKSFRRIGVGRSGSRKCFVTADFASAR